MIKTFIFDVGKVLIDFDHLRIVSRIEQHCNFSETEIYQKVFATSAIKDYETGKISSIRFFEQIKQLLDLRMNFIEFSDAWNSTFEPEPILPEGLIKNLAEKHRLLILSDTNELHFEFIKVNFPILRFFNDYILSYQVGASKPAPEIFLSAIEKANCPPNECFFIDDRETNVQGAQKVGINAVQFLSAEQLTELIQNTFG